MAPKTHFVLFSQANMNAIDGSSVWAQSITLALAALIDVEVTLLLSHPITTDKMLEPLFRHPAISVIDPVASGLATGPLTLSRAEKILVETTVSGRQAIVVRGAAAAHQFAKNRRLKGKLWPYLTDVPQRVEDVDRRTREQIKTIASASPILLCQTEELGSFLESMFPVVAGKVAQLPPAVPGDVEPNILPPPTSRDLQIVYAGKFARTWNTLEMCDLPAQLAERGIVARLTMVGDKVNKDPAHPEFVANMQRGLKSSFRVDWAGGVSRESSIGLMASAHIGLSWRSPDLDDSLELSTKLLEYCAAGTPPILNRTAMHERIFGRDYPLFVDSDHTVIDLLELVTEHSELYEHALHRTSHLAADYTVEKASERLATLIAAQFDREPQTEARSQRNRSTKNSPAGG